MLVELRTIIQNEISVDDLRLSIESSIGFAMTPEDATNTDVLLQWPTQPCSPAKNPPPWGRAL